MQLRSDDDEEDRAELAEHDRQMAEAWRIRNKYHSHPAEKCSNSELSVLGSSQFNGMEGIETGSGSGSEIHDSIGSNSTVFRDDSEAKASRYGRILRKKTE
jgi:hypothetical protein